MRRFASVSLVLLLAAGIHIDWHLARPLHHRLRLDWRYHWVYAALLFAGVASLVVARWRGRGRWRMGAWVLVWGLVVAQLVEPVLTVAYYEHRLAYEVEPERWRVFSECLAAGLPTYVVVLGCLRRRTSPARVV